MNKLLLNILLSVWVISCTSTKGKTNLGSWKELKNEATRIGKAEWQPMLAYVADLHEKSTHPAKCHSNTNGKKLVPVMCMAQLLAIGI